MLLKLVVVDLLQQVGDLVCECTVAFAQGRDLRLQTSVHSVVLALNGFTRCFLH
jgi:hypothetical protein